MIHDYGEEPIGYREGRFKFNDKYITDLYQYLALYVDEGLSAKVDAAFIPQVGKVAKATLCFDPFQFDIHSTIIPIRKDQLKNTCTQELAKPGSAKTVTISRSTISGARAGDRGSSAGSSGSMVNPAQKPTSNSTTSTIAVTAPTNAKFDVSFSPDSASDKPDFTFTDQDGKLIELQTRSVFGAYRFLGELLLLREQAKTPQERGYLNKYLGELFTADPATDFLSITHDTTDCWAEVDYEGSHWCVSTKTIGTKRVFTILHQLFELYAQPNNQPATPTVRVTPGG